MKIHKGDQVKIISGNDKGKAGKVLRVLTTERKLVVEGINIHKKHMRPRQTGKKGELIKIASPLAISRVMLICPKCNQAARTSSDFVENKKYRACKRCRAII